MSSSHARYRAQFQEAEECSMAMRPHRAAKRLRKNARTLWKGPGFPRGKVLADAGRWKRKMITLACFVAVGLILGMFFNVYALSALSMLVASLNFPSAFTVGIGHAAMSAGVSVVLLQIGYFAGLLASRLLYSTKPASIPTSRM